MHKDRKGLNAAMNKGVVFTPLEELNPKVLSTAYYTFFLWNSPH